MNVLYLSHTSRVSGGERALLDLLSGLPERVSATVACPEGDLAELVRAGGKPVAAVPGTDGSLKLHPWRTPRAMLDIVRAGMVARRLAAAAGADLIHANSIRAGLSAAVARRLGGPPAIVYLHDALPPGASSRLISRAVGAGAAALVANSRYTADRFEAVAGSSSVRVNHCPTDLNRFDPAKIDRAAARAGLGLAEATTVLALVAQITPWKGQAEAIRMVGELKRAHPDIRLLIVGKPVFVSRSTRYDNLSYLRDLEALTRELDLIEEVTFLGQRRDIPEILRAADVALVPSWEEPFGRAVTEAMAMAIPVVATAVGGPSEIIRDGVDGFLLPPDHPSRWIARLDELISRSERRTQIGASGRRRVAELFTLEAHVEAMLSAYADVLGSGRGDGG